MAPRGRSRAQARSPRTGRFTRTTATTAGFGARGAAGPRRARGRTAPPRMMVPAKPRKAAAPKTQGSQVGYKTSTLTLAKPMSRSAMTAKLTQSMLESVIYRWNGVKAFSGNGYYWMQNRVIVAGTRALPWYMMDLTAVNNYNGTALVSYPFLQLRQDVATGGMYFAATPGVTPSGVGTTTNFQVEKAPGGPAATSDSSPFGKSMISHASIQANLWGATSKATKYMVQVVQITDEDLVPDHALAFAGTELTLATPKRNDFYQNMIKSWTFNPISTTGGVHSRKYKVLKTQTITIEPNPTTDGDADAQCVVYKAFLKLNKLMKYEESAVALATDGDTNDQADYALNTGAQVTAQANPKSRIYLVIRATNYGADAGDTSQFTPSFDLSVRIKHTIPK